MTSILHYLPQYFSYDGPEEEYHKRFKFEEEKFSHVHTCENESTDCIDEPFLGCAGEENY